MIDIEHEQRGELSLVLTSPSGTRSNILSPRPLDKSSEGIDFTFMTVHHWGEDPAGTWTLQIEDHGKGGTTSYSHRRGRLLSWSLALYGVTGERPNHHSTDDSTDRVFPVPSEVHKDGDSSDQARHVGTSEVKELMEKEAESSDSVQIQSKDEMATKRNDRRRKWLLEKGFEPEDVDFLLALFETEQDEKRRKSSGESSAKQRRLEIPDYRWNLHNYGNSRNQDSKWRRTYDAGHSSLWNPNKRSNEKDEQRIVDLDAITTTTESWITLMEELESILEEE